MKLIKRLSQRRRDFQGVYKCEFCGNTDKDSSMNSYDDEFFHTEVIPSKKCKNCGESTLSKGGDITPTATRYPEGMQL